MSIFGPPPVEVDHRLRLPRARRAGVAIDRRLRVGERGVGIRAAAQLRAVGQQVDVPGVAFQAGRQGRFGAGGVIERPAGVGEEAVDVRRAMS